MGPIKVRVGVGPVKASFDPHYGYHPWVSPPSSPKRHLAISSDMVGGFFSGSLVKNWSAVWETWVQSMSREGPLEKEMATHSSILTWRIPWTEEPLRLQSIGSQKVRHN